MLQHLLFAFLAIVAPVWDFYATQRLKKNPVSVQKIGYYKILCAWLWIASFVAVVTVGFREVFTIAPMPDDPAWLLGHVWVRFVVEAVVAVFFGLIFLPFLCITAGICEETLFRGFMLHYLRIFPWSLNLTLALLTSSLILG